MNKNVGLKLMRDRPQLFHIRKSNDFLDGLPVRAGLGCGEARGVGGRGRPRPRRCSDGAAASLRAASRGCAATLAPVVSDQDPPKAAAAGGEARREAGFGERERRAELALRHFENTEGDFPRRP